MTCKFGLPFVLAPEPDPFLIEVSDTGVLGPVTTPVGDAVTDKSVAGTTIREVLSDARLPTRKVDAGICFTGPTALKVCVVALAGVLKIGMRTESRVMITCPVSAKGTDVKLEIVTIPNIGEGVSVGKEPSRLVGRSDEVRGFDVTVVRIERVLVSNGTEIVLFNPARRALSACAIISPLPSDFT